MVKRYDLEVTGFGDDFYTIMGEIDGGEFVRWEDYEEVAEKLEKCETELRRSKRGPFPSGC